jgi:hypothetical protein
MCDQCAVLDALRRLSNQAGVIFMYTSLTHCLTSACPLESSLQFGASSCCERHAQVCALTLPRMAPTQIEIRRFHQLFDMFSPA